MPMRVTRAAARLAASEGQTLANNTLDALPRRKSRAAINAEKPKSPVSEVEDAAPPKVIGKRVRDISALPHGLGDIPSPSEGPIKKARTSNKAIKKEQKIKKEGQEDSPETKLTVKSSASRKTKVNYGITLGSTPYPDFTRPTPDECREIVDLLSSVHGKVRVPAAIPEASLTRAGCGEVPSVLDALIRTLISQNVTAHNAGLALSGLIKKFGTVQNGIGKGSIDYNKIRLAPLEDLVDAIRRLGCQDQKGAQIKKILQMAWEENQERRAGLKSSGDVPGSAHEAAESKDAEIAKAEGGVLSLDHLHLLSAQEAFDALLKYPGIGVKTAACVCLFCLRRPVFAIDTHCYRLAQWLGWLPSAADLVASTAGATGKKVRLPALTRDTAFAHLDARVPDELKYALHKLLIMHGKNCPRCRAITSNKSADWGKGCVIDHLVQRTGARKGGSLN